MRKDRIPVYARIPEGFISTTDAAKLTHYSKKHIQRLFLAGAIKGYRWGKLILIDRASLLSYRPNYKRDPAKRIFSPIAKGSKRYKQLLRNLAKARRARKR